jgi:hypothetical protein
MEYLSDHRWDPTSLKEFQGKICRKSVSKSRVWFYSAQLVFIILEAKWSKYQCMYLTYNIRNKWEHKQAIHELLITQI